MVQQLLVEHCDYAVDLGLQSVPIAENKTPPKVNQNTAIFFKFARISKVWQKIIEKNVGKN